MGVSVCASGTGGSLRWWVIPALFAKVAVSNLQPSLHSRDRSTDDRVVSP